MGPIGSGRYAIVQIGRFAANEKATLALVSFGPGFRRGQPSEAQRLAFPGSCDGLLVDNAFEASQAQLALHRFTVVVVAGVENPTILDLKDAGALERDFP